MMIAELCHIISFVSSNNTERIIEVIAQSFFKAEMIDKPTFYNPFCQDLVSCYDFTIRDHFLRNQAKITDKVLRGLKTLTYLDHEYFIGCRCHGLIGSYGARAIPILKEVMDDSPTTFFEEDDRGYNYKRDRGSSKDDALFKWLAGYSALTEMSRLWERFPEAFRITSEYMKYFCKYGTAPDRSPFKEDITSLESHRSQAAIEIIGHLKCIAKDKLPYPGGYDNDMNDIPAEYRDPRKVIQTISEQAQKGIISRGGGATMLYLVHSAWKQ